MDPASNLKKVFLQTLSSMPVPAATYLPVYHDT